MKRRLVIQLARMGDVVQSLPLLERMKQSNPKDSITLLIDNPLIPLFQGLSGIDQVVGFPMEAAWNSVRQSDFPPQFAWWQTALSPLLDQTFDQVMVLNYSRLAVIMGDLFQTQERKGYFLAENREHIRRPPSLNLLIASVQHRRYARWHLSDLYRALEQLPPYEGRGEYKGGQSNGLIRWHLSTKPPIDSGKKQVGIIIGAGDSKRLLSVEFYADLILNLLTSDLFSIVLIGGPTDTDRQQQIIASLDLKYRQHVFPTAGNTALSELPDLLGSCDLVVGPDTGPLHIAAWCNIPTLGLYFASASVHQTGPYGRECAVLDVQLPCRPCREDDPCQQNECLKLFSPESLVKAIHWIFKENGPNRSIAPCGRGETGIKPYTTRHLSWRTTQFDDWGITFPDDFCSDGDLLWQRNLFGKLLFPESNVPTQGNDIPDDVKNQLIGVRHGEPIPYQNESLAILQDFLNLEDQEGRPETRERIAAILTRQRKIGIHSVGRPQEIMAKEFQCIVKI